MLETIDNDLLEILSDENPPRNRNNANEAVDETYLCVHLKIPKIHLPKKLNVSYLYL